MTDDDAPDFAQLATRELLTNGDLPGPEGVAGRHRARTWAMLALARATDRQAMTDQPTTESETP